MSLSSITLTYSGGRAVVININGKLTVDVVERHIIINEYLNCKGSSTKAALKLGMNRSTVGNRLRDYGLLHIDGGGKTDLYIELQREFNIAKNKEVTG